MSPIHPICRGRYANFICHLPTRQTIPFEIATEVVVRANYYNNDEGDRNTANNRGTIVNNRNDVDEGGKNAENSNNISL